jgi:hypothetical protein
MRRAACILLVIGWCFGTGCEPAKKPEPKPVAQPVEEQDHGHEHGPNGGIAIALAGGDFKAEAKSSKSNNLIQVFILSADAKSVRPIKADSVVVRTDKLGGKSFTLQPVNPDAEGLAAEYSLDDAELKQISGLKPALEVTVDGKTHTGALEFH